MRNLLQDFRYSLRQLRKSPGFLIVAILTLALGIGANTAIFSVVNALMLRPLPYPEPARLGALITHWNSAKGVEDDDSVNGDTYLLVRDQVPAVTAAAYGMESGVNLQAGQNVQYVQQLRVSSKYFDVLGIAPRVGRGFTREEDRSNVVKTPGLYGGAPLVSEPTLYIPAMQAKQGLVSMAHVWFQPSWIVRTRGPIASVTGDMQHALAQADPTLPFSGFYSMAELEQHALGMQRIEVTLLGSLAGLALLLSAIGIYGLIASLVVQRTWEIGIRLALGSSIRQAMVEIGRSGVVATTLGLGVGLGASPLALRALKSFVYGIGAYDCLTLVGTALILGTVALAATFLPTRHIARIDPAKTLREE